MKAYLMYFFAYAFIGWCAEVIFAALKNGHFVNRGFLNGPLCPIYGCGIVAVLLCAQPFQGSLWKLYVSSVVVTTLIELVTGYLMEKLFHHRWWDYSKMPLNIGGYVCPLFSLIWGFACILIVNEIHPRIAHLLGFIPETLATVLLCVFGALTVADVIVTVLTVVKLNKRLKQIDEVSATLRTFSDKFGSTLADGALAVKSTDEKVRSSMTVVAEKVQTEAQARREELAGKAEQVQESLKARREELSAKSEQSQAELRAKLDGLTESLAREQKRFIDAFPSLRSVSHEDALNKAKETLSRLRESRRKK